MEILTLIITNIVTPIITGVVTWGMAKKKYDSEVDLTLISNMKESLDFYKQLSDDNKERLAEMLKKNDELEKEISGLKNQMLNLTMNICMDLTCANRILSELSKKKESRYSNRSKKKSNETDTKENSKKI